MRAFLFFLLGLVVGACAQTSAQPPQAPTRMEMAADLQAKTVALVYAGRVYCSGVWVGDTLIATAAHCVDDGPQVEYVVHEDVFGYLAPPSLAPREHFSSRAALVLALDPDHDVALLLASSIPNHRVAKLAVDGVAAGQFVQTCGHSLGLWWSYSSGDVAALRRLEKAAEQSSSESTVLIQTTAPISPGNSGGGLFDGAKMLIGLGHAQVPRGSNLGFFVHAQHLADLMRQAGIK